MGKEEGFWSWQKGPQPMPERKVLRGGQGGKQKGLGVAEGVKLFSRRKAQIGACRVVHDSRGLFDNTFQSRQGVITESFRGARMLGWSKQGNHLLQKNGSR